MNKLLSLALCLLTSMCVFAQKGWTAEDIPDSLKRDAYSVVRTCELMVNASSQKVLTTHQHMVVTILSKKGDSHAVWSCGTSRFEKLVSFTGKVYDARGKVVAKFKQGDIHSSQYSEHLASDNQHNYIEPPVMDYPYTVEYDWEVKSTDGYMEYGFFMPVTYDRQALQHAEFMLTVPSGTQIRHKAMSASCEPGKTAVEKSDRYTWTMSARRCIIDDVYDDDALYMLPLVIAMPANFVFGESSGSLDSWESLGKWYAQLAEGRGTLLPADVAKVKELTAGYSSDREKIEALYGYLAEKTRYVSIQLGIGGWQPMKAEEVGKTGFGDCKALTNYMQALLREAGIRSYQTIISTEYQNLLERFPNMHQTNHVVLTVPQADGSNLVVECTNPRLPLGYVSDSYAGHEALLVNGSESKLIRIADYTPENSYEALKADVLLHADGTSIVAFTCQHYGARYEGVRALTEKSEKERKDVVAHWTSLRDPVVTEAMVFDEKGIVPHLDVHSTMNVTYGEVHGDKIFLTCNPFRRFAVPRMRNGRQRPLVVTDAYALNDEFRIELPDGYACTTDEINESQSTDFGSYSFNVRQEGNHLIIKTVVSISKGRFDIAKKDDFIAFRESVSKMMKRILILEKK